MARKKSDAKPAKSAKSRTPGVACVILAAGQGTRMRSAHSKVLHEVLGRPLVAYPTALALDLGADPVVAVLGHQRKEVEAALSSRFPDAPIKVAEQTERLGTGHALRIALPALRNARGILLVLCGDVPLVERKSLSALVGTARRYSCLAVMTATPPDPTGYGRIVRDERGHVLRIVEHKDATDEERAITEVNAGIYAAPIEFFRKAAAGLVAKNAQHEYYLTDVVARAAESIGVSTVEADYRDVAGVNDRQQLVAAETRLRARVNGRWMEHATFRDPASTVVEPDVVIGVDVELGRGVALRGRTKIGHGARIGDGCILTDTVVGAGADVKPYTVATEASIGVHAKVGPFSHLRPGADLGPDAHVGNFVELKKTQLGRGSKANHLTYLGDSVIGAGVNIGAGTITCNYNGYEKFQTVIEDGAFIGSDTQLVAPVKVGKKAVVAAGTTITGDVTAGALAISRVKQTEVAGYAQKVARRYADAPAKKPSRVSS
ncbi:MAG TPA: bifunctional UDP-N-acetylglucosamine diphosphorylase/glucosamine-1-phosphate N-acetyltransferase GlmU [Polyangia bacterium]|jgi:bifunctional UDP-N-acetylglucosamine pyrophosphorylase/glucosamine-1-phosphate N-acetyltransferase|nr:bifunctional UDP-N-acetylglucosamine diphosphorylase/glucosamine-1-phosphate N-acetyltransferase GlmU [Polyangia bacterium]